jgi:hypothetical protein
VEPQNRRTCGKTRFPEAAVLRSRYRSGIAGTANLWTERFSGIFREDLPNRSGARLSVLMMIHGE